MPRPLRTAMLALVLLLSTGCVSQSDYEELRTDFATLLRDHEALQSDLGKWTQDLHVWQADTYAVICDLLAESPQSHAEEAALYCPADETDGETAAETADGGPPAPPAFRY